MQTDVEFESWGFEDPREIKHGRFHIIHQTGHDRLSITSLLGESPTLQLKTAAKPRVQDIPSLKIVSPLSMRNVNLFGGRHSTFSHPPSSAKLERFSDGVGYQSLAFTYDNQDSGFCGLWMHLFDSTQDISIIQPFDASRFAYLTFWVKGNQGGESIWVKAADVNWLQKDDALPIGQIDSFLPAGQVTQEWQQAVIPLAELPDRLAARELATLVFQPKGSHAGTVELRGIAFCNDPQTAKAHTNPFHDTLTSNKALWIWNTVDFLRDKKERQELKAVLQKHGFDTVFIQVPFAPNLTLDRGRLADLIATLKQDGVSVHALDG
ncbi:hypothetical protein GF373_03470, partial [bacterium]|nr:hypothetical protein [bacterium]